MTWTTPITDRTLSDVDYLISLRNKIMEFGFAGLTTDEQQFWKFGESENLFESGSEQIFTSDSDSLMGAGHMVIRGAFNLTDLNRIENNAYYLQQYMLNYGYGSGFVSRLNWLMVDVPFLLEHTNRIRSNIDMLSNNILPTGITPILNYHGLITLDDANAMEQALFLIKQYFDYLVSICNPCGVIVSGEVY